MPSTLDAAEVSRVTTGLLYLMGYEVALREIDPQRAREEATRAVLDLRRGRDAPTRPVVMVLSDLHWADQLVLDLVATLVDRLCRQRFVLLATARQAVTERWTAPTGRHNTVLVNLDPLDADAAGDLLDALVDGDLSDAVRGPCCSTAAVATPSSSRSSSRWWATSTSTRRVCSTARPRSATCPTPCAAWSRPASTA